MNSAPVLKYHQYSGGRESQTVYTTHHYCSSCRRRLDSCYGFPDHPEDLEERNNATVGWVSPETERVLDYFKFCPWCGVTFQDEWWMDHTIQNERVIDHYQNPGTHKGDTHEFRGTDPDCMTGHWLSVSGGDRVCWCDPDVEPGLMGCVIRHQDKRYEDVMAADRATREESDSDEGIQL